VITLGGSGKIRILPGDVVSRIAAGEVIERPAAVVKELLENSLDAGSRSITVDIKDGGLSFIRVTDDGEGMSRDDAPRAFERHATSKLRSDEDLWSIRTMGFRGEALPSIASVSRVRLVTATRSAGVGTECRITGGQIERIHEAPPLAGTRIEVADLFYNQPARKKFLKSIPTEFSHISRVIQQAALAWPSVHFRLTHNAHDVLNYPSVPSEKDRIGQVYRAWFLDQILPVADAVPIAKVSGFTVDAVHAGSGRTPQELFINRRPVRNPAIFHAIAEGYGSFLPRGHHPLFVLYLDVDADRVDVNVHPAKREVRFSDQDTIHQFIRRAVRAALGTPQEQVGALVGRPPAPSLRETSAMGHAGRFPLMSIGESGAQISAALPGSGELSQLAFVSEAAESYVQTPSTEVVALGQLNRTFLVVQIGSDLAVIDQHTAHERVLFERLLRAWSLRQIQCQPLLIPEPIELSAPQAALLQRYREELTQLGVELEPFGTSAMLLRAVPVGVGNLRPSTLVQDLLDDVAEWDHAPTMEARVRPVLASLACHGAVRAGRPMELPEIKALIDDWIAAGAISTCPHGRRTSFKLSTHDLEKMFGRAGW
jgi:DNA mismatch repair protein MutL